MYLPERLLYTQIMENTNDLSALKVHLLPPAEHASEGDGITVTVSQVSPHEVAIRFGLPPRDANRGINVRALNEGFFRALDDSNWRNQPCATSPNCQADGARSPGQSPNAVPLSLTLDVASGEVLG